jgi:hypothetical protein
MPRRPMAPRAPPSGETGKRRSRHPRRRPQHGDPDQRGGPGRRHATYRARPGAARPGHTRLPVVRGAMTDLGTLGGSGAAPPHQRCRQWSHVGDRRRGGPPLPVGGRHMTDLGTLPGFGGGPRDRINEAGSVVGFAVDPLRRPRRRPTGGPTRSAVPGSTGDGDLLDLGTLGGPNSVALAAQRRPGRCVVRPVRRRAAPAAEASARRRREEARHRRRPRLVWRAGRRDAGPERLASAPRAGSSRHRHHRRQIVGTAELEEDHASWRTPAS